VRTTDVNKLQDAINMINQYIIDQKLQPITSTYLVQTKKENLLCIEIYIGINLTHSHPDHIGAANELLIQFSAH